MNSFIDGCIRFHRAEFLDIFIKCLPENVAHFRKRVLSYTLETSKGSIQLQFQDNSVATCDVLIGCDGIKSMVRAKMYQNLAIKTGKTEFLDAIEPVFSGTIAYRGLIPVENMPINVDGNPHRTIHSPMMVSPVVCFNYTKFIIFSSSIVVRIKFVCLWFISIKKEK